MPIPWLLPNIGREIISKWNNPGEAAQAPWLSKDQLPFGEMHTESGEKIALKSAHISGEIDGLLFSSRISQIFRNETEEDLEISYTFPIAWGTTLLGLDTKIGDKLLEGKVMEKAKTEAAYEDAKARGDTAIMVRESSPGLFNVRLGNVAAGGEVRITLHCAQLLHYEQDQIRLCIPTVIGQRYGDPHCSGALPDGEETPVDNGAYYPLGLDITITGALARSAISSPTHCISLVARDNRIEVSLDEGATLDRDFVLLLKGAGLCSHGNYIKSDSGWVTLANFAASLDMSDKSSLCLKVLVDCSGSMMGESINQAIRGVRKIVEELGDGDYFSFSKFGTDLIEMTATPVPCTGNFKSVLRSLISETRADMGGTEMAMALRAVIRQKIPARASELPSAILLITDGDIWDLENIENIARESGQRVYVIGVGSAPAEGPLARLAQASGGACEFVTPNENMEAAIERAFRRMRTQRAMNVKMDWGQTPLWQSAPPKSIYPGETVHLFALLPEEPKVVPALSWRSGGQDYTESLALFEESLNHDLLRLYGKSRMTGAENQKEALALALQYGLVSPLTSLFLVYKREQKAKGKTALHYVPQMPAHGHGMNKIVGAALSMSQIGSVAGLLRSFAGPQTIDRAMPSPGRKSIRSSLARTLNRGGYPDSPAQYKKFRKKVLRLWHNKSNNEDVLDIINARELAPLAGAIQSIAKKLNIPKQSVWRAYLFWLLAISGESDAAEKYLVMEADEKSSIETLNQLFTQYF